MVKTQDAVWNAKTENIGMGKRKYMNSVSCVADFCINGKSGNFTKLLFGCTTTILQKMVSYMERGEGREKLLDFPKKFHHEVGPRV